MSEIIKVEVNSQILDVEVNTPLAELAARVQDAYDTPITAAKIDGVLRELQQKIKKGTKKIEFIDLRVKDGIRIYQRTATFILIVARQKLFPKKMHFS